MMFPPGRAGIEDQAIFVDNGAALKNISGGLESRNH